MFQVQTQSCGAQPHGDGGGFFKCNVVRYLGHRKLRGVSVRYCILLKACVADCEMSLLESGSSVIQPLAFARRTGPLHSVAELEAFNAFTKLFYRPSDVRPYDGRVLGHNPPKFLDLPVDGVQRDGVDLEEQLTRPWSRYGDGANDEVRLLRRQDECLLRIWKRGHWEWRGIFPRCGQ